MTLEQEKVRDLQNEIAGLKARKEKVKELALNHRSTLKDENLAKYNEQVRTKELELENAILTKENELRDAKEARNSQKQENIKGEQKRMETLKNVLAFTEGMDAREAKDTIDYRSGWLKTLRDRKIAVLGENEQRAMTTVNNVAVMPTITLNLIMGRLTAEGTLAGQVTIHNIANWLSIPIEDSVHDAAWVAEGVAGTAGDDTTRSINLTAYKLMRFIKVTKEARTLSIDAFETWIIDRLIKKMQIGIENAIANGTGSGQPTGFITGTTWTTGTNQIEVAAGGSLSYDNMVDLENLIGEEYSVDMVYIMNRQSLAKVRKLKDDTKRPLFEREVENGFQGTIGGVPVLLSRNVNGIYLGSWTQAWVGNWISPIEFAESTEAAFMSGDTIFRALALFDGKPTGIDGTIARINFAS